MGGVSGFPPSTTSPGRPRLRLLSCLVRSLRHVTCTLLVSSKSRNGIDLDVNGALAVERKTPSPHVQNLAVPAAVSLSAPMIT